MDDTPRTILIVDDDPSTRSLIAELLSDEFRIVEAGSGEEALELFRSDPPQLVLLDIMLGGIDGYETCRRLKYADDTNCVQVIMVSSISSREEQLKGYYFGADDYIVKPVNTCELKARVQIHFRLHEAMREVDNVRQEIAKRNSELKRLTEWRLRQVIETQDVAVFSLAKLAESRDDETGKHLNRMRIYAQCLAQQLRNSPYAPEITDSFLESLYRSSPLHDIGKVAICDSILLKPGPLTEAEFAVMQQHTVIGGGILDEAVMHSPSGGFLSMAAVIARYHHERFDGSGYPEKLIGEDIPLAARIVALADVFDALTSSRPYKRAFDPSIARQMILAERGGHFDPIIVDAFEAIYDEFVSVVESLGDQREDFIKPNAFIGCQELQALRDSVLMTAY